MRVGKEGGGQNQSTKLSCKKGYNYVSTYAKEQKCNGLKGKILNRQKIRKKFDYFWKSDLPAGV
jgi:hypothetical protein